MNNDLDNEVFNEKDLFSGTVVGEDGPNVDANSEAGEDEGEGEDREEPIDNRIPSPPGSSQLNKRPDPKSKAETKPKKKKKKSDQILFWLETKYDVLPEICSHFELWREATGPDDDLDLLWCDQAISADRFIKMKSYQKVNHFVGMTSITRKNNLGRNLLRMKKHFQKEYRFFPDTWILPTDLADFKQQFTAKKNKTFIVKPDNGYQGKGIFLTRDFEKIPIDYSQTWVAQRYIHKPYLLDGHKFDLRLFVLVTGCDPLRIFLHEKGLVRLASEEYVEPKGKNLQNSMMHLTNYAINAGNENFKENTNPEDGRDGHKRGLQAVYEELAKEGCNIDQLKEDIEDLVIKTLIAVQPSLAHVYHSCQPDDVENSMCFEILGFDVMIDHKCKPWLIEVNHAPSFRTETELDTMVKTSAVEDAFTLLNLTPETKRRYKRESRQALEQRALGINGKRSIDERMLLEETIARRRTAWEEEHSNGYKKLFPSAEKEDEYAKYVDAAIDIWETLTGGTSRRSVRLNGRRQSEDPESKDDKGTLKRSGPNSASRSSDTGNRDDRSNERLKSAVARLAKAAVSPAGGGAKKRASSAGEADCNLDASSASVSLSSGLLEEKKDAAVKSESKSQSSSSHSRNRRPDVEIGDIVKVQTNLGWEAVVVAKKYDNGKLDIKFEDGETMREVMPRILKRQPQAQSSDERRPSSAGAPLEGNSQSNRETSSSHAPKRPDGAGPLDTNGRAGARSPPPPPPPNSDRGAGKRPQPSFVSQAVAALRAQQALGSESPTGSAATEEFNGSSSPRSGGGSAHGSATRTGSHPPNQPRDALTQFDRQLSKRIKQALGDPSLAAMRQQLSQAGIPAGAGSLPLSVQGAGAAAAPTDPRSPAGRAAEARLRQQLNQLIHVRPILARRGGRVPGPGRTASSEDRRSTTGGCLLESGPRDETERSRSSAPNVSQSSLVVPITGEPAPSRSGVRSCKTL